MTTTHTDKSPLAGQTIEVKFSAGHPQIPGSKDLTFQYIVEDWWDHMTGGSWMDAEGNPACLVYAIRTGFAPPPGIPFDDQVLYGKIDGLGHLVHTSEIVTPTRDERTDRAAEVKEF